MRLAADQEAAFCVALHLFILLPGNLPFERPTTFDLVVNMKMAKALGIKIPQSILVRPSI